MDRSGSYFPIWDGPQGFQHPHRAYTSLRTGAGFGSRDFCAEREISERGEIAG